MRVTHARVLKEKGNLLKKTVLLRR